MVKKVREVNRQKKLKPIGEILKSFDPKEKKYISQEFQDYGYRLAEELKDLKHKALYFKLAKEAPRALLEEARNFVKDASQVRNRGKLFMWKLGELKKAKE
ncbi:hypothetical protein ACFL0Y_04630 [Patescibacteria group bacterium]